MRRIKPRLFFHDGQWRVGGWYDTAHKEWVEAACDWAHAMNMAIGMKVEGT